MVAFNLIQQELLILFIYLIDCFYELLFLFYKKYGCKIFN